MTAQVVGGYLPALHRLVDALALLDMLAGFSLVAGGGAGGGGAGDRPYVRPVITEVRGRVPHRCLASRRCCPAACMLSQVSRGGL